MDDLQAIHISGAIEQARDLVEAYVKPETVTLEEPGTGVRALFAKTGNWYELWRTDRTFDHAFSEAVERVRVETELPVLLGKPEA